MIALPPQWNWWNLSYVCRHFLSIGGWNWLLESSEESALVNLLRVRGYPLIWMKWNENEEASCSTEASFESAPSHRLRFLKLRILPFFVVHQWCDSEFRCPPLWRFRRHGHNWGKLFITDWIQASSLFWSFGLCNDLVSKDASSAEVQQLEDLHLDC